MKTPRTDAEIENIRDEILNRALDIIISGGLDALTMRKLAGKLNMTAPNLYNYFSGKDEIYITLVIQGFEMLYGRLKSAYDRQPDLSARARDMIEAYVQFGMAHPQYYDIMFTRPTPKYNDYVGTAHESLSEIEFKLSMAIVELAMSVAADQMKTRPDDKRVRQRVIQIWSLLHGMITLHNSGVVDYVVEAPKDVYRAIIDEFLDSLQA